MLDRDWRRLPRPALDHPDQHLLWEAEQMTTALEDASVAPGARPAFQRRLREYVDEISRLAGLLLRREHQIAFVGSIGIGNSTAICRATGLEIPGQQGRSVPVLETRGGGVTLCEVHLGVGPGSGSGFGVIVEPRTHDDIRSDVEDFVDQLLQAEPSTVDDDGAHAVPREVERAIRNMAGLVSKRIKAAKDPQRDMIPRWANRSVSCSSDEGSTWATSTCSRHHYGTLANKLASLMPLAGRR